MTASECLQAIRRYFSRRAQTAARPTQRTLELESLEDRITPIVGAIGMPAFGWEFTGVVQLFGDTDGDGDRDPMGTGTLLSSGRHVLTAAHVLTDDDGTFRSPDVQIRFHSATSTGINGTVVANIVVPTSALWIHPEYDGGDIFGQLDYDVAVATLPELAPVSATRHALFRGTDEVGRWGYIVGYGEVGISDQPTSTNMGKRVGTNTIEEIDSPNNSILQFEFDSNPNQWADGSDPLNPSDRENEAFPYFGDSGGPFFLWGTSPNLEVAGITSYIDLGLFDSTPDTGGFPWSGDDAFYSRVSAFAGQIDTVMSGSYDLVVDMLRQPRRTDGNPETVEVLRVGSNVEVRVHGQVAHTGRIADIRSITLRGSSQPDTFIVNAGLNMPIEIDGRGGSDRLIVRGTQFEDSVQVSATEVSLSPDPSVFLGTTRVRFAVGGVEALQIDTLQDIDTITVTESTRSMSVTINGGFGNDVVSVGNNLAFYQGDIRFNGEQNNDEFRINDTLQTTGGTYISRTDRVLTNNSGANFIHDGVETVTLTAGTGNDTVLVGGSLAGTTLNVRAGSGINNVTLGSDVALLGALQGRVVVDGSLGTDTVTLLDDLLLPSTAYPSSVLDDSYTIDATTVSRTSADLGAFGGLTYQAVESLVLNTEHGPNLITVNGTLRTDLTINAGQGGDHLVMQGGRYIQETYTPTNATSGTISLQEVSLFIDPTPWRVTYANLETISDMNTGTVAVNSLVVNGSNTADDRVVVQNGPTVNGIATTQIRSDNGTFATVNFANKGAATLNTLGGNDTVQFEATSLASGLSQMTINGGAGTDTLVGALATANTFSITGRDVGTLNGRASYGTVENLAGGLFVDTFVYQSAGRVTGNISGGGFGGDLLDFSAFGASQSVQANLTTGLVNQVDTTMQVSGITHVNGGAGNDVLVGNGSINRLNGNAGRDLLIGGGGSYQLGTTWYGDSLDGGTGEDVLVGGRTSHDANASALGSLMSEWTRTDLAYGGRVQNLLAGGGRNGTIALNLATFNTAGIGDTLTGQGGAAELDLFFGSRTGDTHDWTAGTSEVFVDPAVNQFTIRFDATALYTSWIWLDGAAVSAAQAFTRTLGVGQHSLRISGGDTFTFQVTEAGIVTDPTGRLASLTTGLGTPNLTITGIPVTFQASQVYSSYLWVNGRATASSSAFTVNLLPGQQDFRASGGGTYSFRVNADRSLSDPTGNLAGIATISGSTLTVTGRAVQFDADELSSNYLWVNGRATASSSPFTVNLLPGQHDFRASGGGTFTFQVNANGTLGDSSGNLAGIATLAGSTLTVTGVAVLIDADALSSSYLWVNGRATASSSPFTARLLPGQHDFRASGGGTFTFQVNANRTLGDSTGNLAGIATWSGSTLTITGQAVTFDARSLNTSWLWVNGQAYDARSLVNLRLLPGQHEYRGSNGITYQFQVSAVGLLVDLENLLGRGLATGFGTRSLTILRL